VCVCYLRLTSTKYPARYHPHSARNDKQDGARTDGHEGLEDKPGVEVDPIEGADGAGGGVGEEAAVEEHHPTDEVETEEHRDGEDDVEGDDLDRRLLTHLRVDGPPCEVVPAGDGVDEAD